METNTNEKKSAVDQVVDGIIDDIIDGKLMPGDKLPTEPDLALKFHVGRNSVREAIKKLEANGVVYIKRADGTFVSENYNHKMLDPMLYDIILQKKSWKDFVELRSVIDIGTLEVIIEKAKPEDTYRDLHRILLNMESRLYDEVPIVDEIMKCDAEFHSAIAKRTNNPQIVTITDYITRLTIPSRMKTIKEVIENGEEENFAALHRQIVGVIEKREKEKIVKTVLDHYVYWK